MKASECPSNVPLRNTFSLAVSSASNPAPNSIRGAMEPRIITSPLYGFKIPLMSFSNVDFPEPFVPTNPQASPGLIFRLISLSAKNSWNINSLLINLMTYSLRLSIFSDAILNLTVASFTSIIYSLSILPPLNIQNKFVLRLQK